MSKKHVPDMDYLMNLKAKKAERTRGEHMENTGEALAEHIMNTEKIQGEHVANTKGTRFEKYKPTELKTFSIRLRPTDIVTLAKYFSRRGTALSQGIRQILLDFIEREGLR